MTREPAASAAFRPPRLARILVGGSGVMSLANGVTIPFLTIYLRNELGLSVSAVGLVIGSSVLFGISGGFLGGALSDIVGRRRVLLSCLLVVIGSFVGFYFARDAATAFAFNASMAFATSAFSPVAKVLISDLLPVALRVKWFSYQYLAINAGYAVGPLIGVALGLTGARLSFPAAAGVYLVYLAVLWAATRQLPRPSTGDGGLTTLGRSTGAIVRGLGESARAVMSDRRLLLLLIGAILLETVHSRISVLLAQNFVIDFADSARVLAAVMTTNAVAVIVLQLFAAGYVQRYNPLNAITLGGILTFVGMAGFAISEQMWHYIVAMVVFTVAETLIVPSEFALVDRIAPEERRGAYFGAQTFAQVGGFTGPFLGSLVLASFGGPVMFLAIGSLALVSVALYLLVGRRIPDLSRHDTLPEAETEKAS
ncbi:MFS transporter [Micromonospora sp. DT46]|uniref:MFS transporter n=1 Tax=unclassified Micromonospora TaxID=2617518 RepID=UPI001CEDF4CA|nr:MULTISPECIES: MFS transporter [unclassified Micromonospora]WSG01363.1 MFS transporter [Micromonospora sp. NBC_01740]